MTLTDQKRPKRTELRVALVVRFFAYILWMMVIFALIVSCAPKQQVSKVDQLKDPAQLVMSDDAEPLDPELSVVPGYGNLTDEERRILYSQNGLSFDLDLHDNTSVEKYVDYFTHKARGTFIRWLERSEQYLPMVREAMDRHDIPHDIAMLPFVESGYNPRALSRAGAGGMWQFMPYTGRKYGLSVNWWIDERRDPYLATEAAISYLKDLHELFGDWHLALAAYNAGEGKIGRAVKAVQAESFFDLSRKNNRLKHKYKLRSETLNYIPKFIAISKIFQNLDAFGFKSVDWTKEPEVEHVKVPGGTDLLALCQAGDMKWAQFHDLNPAYRRQVSPPGQETTAHLPRANAAPMLAYLDNPGSQPFAGYTLYVVRSGNSWSSISNKFGVPISVLKKLNNRSSNLLKIGQTVMVPGQGKSTAVASAQPTSKKATTSATTKKTQQLAQSRSNYKIHSGDTLWDISRRFGVSVRTLQAANGLNSRSKIKVGQKLYIPDATGSEVRVSQAEAQQVQAELVRYRVRRGDNLTKIAKQFSVSVSSIRKWNKMGEKSRIYAGQYLKIYVQ
ncbi:MAG: LysM peptidoglycan-binding domain-containing protein [Proteobacteria bacterium]|nr:LysM peptidoglycan-binding domain-containing protein [Pseudomonadota bacterium]